MKKIAALLMVFSLSACAELQQVVNSLPSEPGLNNDMIASGLRQALDKGIDEQVSKLSAENGFFTNELVRIALPEELQKVDATLRKIGLGSLADEGLKVLNSAASDAVKEATPIFVDAVKSITFTDVRNILMGDNTAATQYLENRTRQALYDKFNPVIQKSFSDVGADQIWSNLITRYNQIPLTANVNPDLTDYVTQEALKGVFTMIAVEEEDIRTQVSSRTTDLLRRVFALQD
ncbi:MAG: DUF4197 domain-containing protein [Leeuwenhoekiella sp.]